jgi:hypothetical protein
MYNTKTSRKKQHREPKDLLWAFLRPLLGYGWGWKEIPGGIKRHRNETIIATPRRQRWKLRLTLFWYLHHLSTIYTKYFTGNGLKSAPFTLFGVDIDCHKLGNPDSARAFAAWLKEHVFPGLYYEASTNGKGAHCFVVLAKKGLEDFEVNRYLKRLQTACRHLLKLFLQLYPEHQIEQVEIKGTCAVITWGRGWQRNNMTSFKAGQLMKCPRPVRPDVVLDPDGHFDPEAIDQLINSILDPEAVDRLIHTTRIDVGFIERLEQLVKRHAVSGDASGLRSAPRHEGDSSDKLATLAASRSTAKPASRSTATPDLLSGEVAEQVQAVDACSLGNNNENNNRLDYKCNPLPVDFSDGRIPDRRHSHWPFWLEYVAARGLFPGLTIQVAARELAVWFWWIEGFHWPDKDARILELLCAFARIKHNGCISRDPEGALVTEQLQRIVGHVQQQTAESKEQFAIVRQKRQTGKYRRIIMLEQVLAMPACSLATTTTNNNRLDYKCNPLPAPIEALLAAQITPRMRRRADGDYPYLEFARPFLHALWDNKGKCRINREACLKMSGSRKPNTQSRFKQLLVQAGLLEPDWQKTIRRYQHAALYKLTEAAMELFRQATRQATA